MQNAEVIMNVGRLWNDVSLMSFTSKLQNLIFSQNSLKGSRQFDVCV